MHSTNLKTIEDKIAEFSARLSNSGCMQCSERDRVEGMDQIPTPRLCGTGIITDRPPIAIVVGRPRETDYEIGRVLSGTELIAIQNWVNTAAEKSEPSSVYITSAIKCSDRNYGTPRKKNIETCANTYLYKELMLVGAKVVIACGDIAIKAMFPLTPTQVLVNYLDTMRSNHRIIVGSDHWVGSVISCRHPAFVQMQGNEHYENNCIKAFTCAFTENIKHVNK